MARSLRLAGQHACAQHSVGKETAAPGAISFTTRTRLRTLRAVRTLVTCWMLSFCVVVVASAQEQERKLIDRLLKPDMSLQNSLQQKEFRVGGNTSSRQIRTKPFYVADRRPERRFLAGVFRTRTFSAKSSRFQNVEAKLPSRTQIATADARYATAAYDHVEVARESHRRVEVADFAGTRPFLLKGKSQKALSQQDRPLTIDEVRELLNKNK